MRGRITITLTVWCGGKNCSEWKHLEGTNKVHVAKEAKRSNWTYTRTLGWLCPECSKKIQEERG